MKRKLGAAVGVTSLLIGVTLAAAGPAHAGIVLYDGANYGGDNLGDFGTGTPWVGSGANDRASSIKISWPANYAILYDHINRQGPRTDAIYSDVSWLGSTSYDFNDRTSSIG